LRRLIAIVVILGLVGFGTTRVLDWWNYNVNTPISSTSHTVPFHVDPGETPPEIGSNLYDLHLIRSTLAWDLYERVTNAGPRLQAGSFVLNTKMSMADIVNELQHGRADEKTITFREGFPLRSFAAAVDQAGLGSAITGSTYLAAAKDPGWAALYNFLLTSPAGTDYPYEGFLFPDTYRVDPAGGARGIVKAQLDQFAVVFSADVRAQIAQPTNARPAEDIRTIVVLASMVDREANDKTPTDRGNVCSVYYNRLAINMPLGVDATLLYALGRLSPEPTGTELQMDSPYNTRKHAGLPPTPISNPGRAALQACVNPAKTNYLFYFTDRQGTTHFETNQQQFDADVAKYGTSGS
jgi:peptidoglycan lytic transglycosylase G